MPNWMDLIQAGGRSVVPRNAIKGLQEAIAPGQSMDYPEGSDNVLLNALGMERAGQLPGAVADIASNIWEHPQETLRGALSGAAGGALGELNPVNLASLAVPGLARAFKGASLVDDVARVAEPTLDVLEDVRVPQANPSSWEVGGLTEELGRRMAEIPNATGRIRRPGMPAPPSQAAPRPSRYSNMPPEFTPRGGEGAYNAGRPASMGPASFMPPPVRR